MFSQARYFFQQLICGVDYCHSLVFSLHDVMKLKERFFFLGFSLHDCFFSMQQICHRDLKLENTLLDGSPAPLLKICDFGYSKVTFISLFFFFILVFKICLPI